jgi:beta-lactamase regulating signal transducer with metallopeptidase domain/uncharacterized GH25 family protein
MSWYTPVWYWLVQTALGTFLILAAGCLAARVCRQPIRRLRLIEITLAACLLVPWLFLIPGLPSWPVARLELPAELDRPVLPENDQQPEGAVGHPPERVQLARQEEPPPEPVTPSRGPGAAMGTQRAPAAPPAAVTPERAGLGWLSLPLVIVLTYAGAVVVFALRRLAGLVQLRRLQAGAYPATGQAAELFAEIAGKAGTRVRLLASDQVEMPLAFRSRRPVILLPGSLCRSGDTAGLRYCLAHEWSHIERRDMRVWNLAGLTQVLFFYQPLLWWLRRQVRLCQDYLADARAAEQAPVAEDYASFLVGLARRLRGPALALGIGDRRSNLYRRIIMLVQNHSPLERRCPGIWNWGSTAGAVVLLAAVVGLRLEAGDPPDKPSSGKTKVEATKDAKGETLTYSGKVTEKGTGKPLEGATVTVGRSLYGDPKVKENKILQETKHVTDAQGKYSFTVPPEQTRERYLYIELDVSHPTHAPRGNFGYALSMIRKNEKMGGRPFFEHVELQPGEPLTGTLQTPEGKPAAGVKILAYSKADVSDFREYGSFAHAKTDAKGVFRATIIKNGAAVFWILPEKYAPSTHVVKKKRGDQGTFVLESGIRLQGKVVDAKGKPVAGVWVNASRRRQRQADEEILQRVADAVNRSCLTNAKGEFALNPLPPGEYEVKPDEYSHDSSREGRQPKRPVPAVFLPQQVTLKEGEKPEALEVRAVPHVIIEAQFLDRKGKPTRGHAPFVFARVDNKFWFGQAKMDADGKVRALAPHGSSVQLDLMTNEHGVLRHRKKAGAPLSNARRMDLGVVNEDVKGIEIIRYEAPILLVKVVSKGGGKPKDAAVTATYPSGRGPFQGRLIVKKGLHSDVSFEEQEDGRFRSSQLLPDEETTVTAQADGYHTKSVKVKLAEATTKELEIVLEKK